MNLRYQDPSTDIREQEQWYLDTYVGNVRLREL